MKERNRSLRRKTRPPRNLRVRVAERRRDPVHLQAHPQVLLHQSLALIAANPILLHHLKIEKRKRRRRLNNLSMLKIPKREASQSQEPQSSQLKSRSTKRLKKRKLIKFSDLKTMPCF